VEININPQKMGGEKMKNFICLILTILYVISPIDIVPDAIPIAGQGDDLLAILLQVRRMYKSISG